MPLIEPLIYVCILCRSDMNIKTEHATLKLDYKSETWCSKNYGIAIANFLYRGEGRNPRHRRGVDPNNLVRLPPLLYPYIQIHDPYWVEPSLSWGPLIKVNCFTNWANESQNLTWRTPDNRTPDSPWQGRRDNHGPMWEQMGSFELLTSALPWKADALST